jgi:hypothetical protein
MADTTPTPTVSVELADAVVRLKKQLVKEFGCDFAFTVMGDGHIIAANNTKDGVIVPKTPEFGVTMQGKVGPVHRSARTGKITRLYWNGQVIANREPDRILDCIIEEWNVYFFVNQLKGAPLGSNSTCDSTEVVDCYPTDEFSEEDIQRLTTLLLARER